MTALPPIFLQNGKDTSQFTSHNDKTDVSQPAKRKAPAETKEAPKARPSKLAKENDITAAEENEIKEAYSLFAIPDKSSKEGVIPIKEVKRALVALGVPPTSPSQLSEFLEILDPDDEGFASYPNFVAICALQLHNRPDKNADNSAEVNHAFELFLGGDGVADDGVITIKHLRRIAKELKEDVDDEVLKDMILEANGGAGMAVGVKRDEFEGVMKRAGVWR